MCSTWFGKAVGVNGIRGMISKTRSVGNNSFGPAVSLSILTAEFGTGWMDIFGCSNLTLRHIHLRI